MSRLSRYLTLQFTVQSLSLFLVASLLVWITQALRLFDVITAKGQDIFTLIGQAGLTTPRLAMAIIYICMGIGLARAMRLLQNSKELHAIHSTKKTSDLFNALAVFTLGGMIITSLVANWIEPLANKTYSKWNEEVAADLVGRALNPNRFSEVVPGLVIVIGDRLNDGTIVDFFANDKRDKKNTRTYISKKAQITFDDKGYNISLIDGVMQIFKENGEFTEISFNKYDLSLDKISNEINKQKTADESDSFTLLKNGIKTGKISHSVWRELNERFSETLRVLALCLFVSALVAYPNARRGKTYFPIELVVLLVALGERTLGTILTKFMPSVEYSSSIILLIIAMIIFIYKQRGFIFLSKREAQI